MNQPLFVVADLLGHSYQTIDRHAVRTGSLGLIRRASADMNMNAARDSNDGL